MHKSQVMLYFLAVFVVGVFVASFLTVSSGGILVLLMLGVAALALSVYHKTFGRSAAGIRRRKLGFLAGCLVLVFALGIWRFNTFNADHTFLLQFAGRTAGDKEVATVLRGYVDGEFDSSGLHGRFPFRVKQIVATPYVLKADERILVSAGSFPRYRYGDMLEMRGAVSVPQNFSDFDYVAYLKKDGIRTVMQSPDISTSARPLKLALSERIKVAVHRKIFIMKDAFENSVNRSVAEPAASYINGILSGSRQNISEPVKESFRKTGTTHILAISGYNITIIAQVLLWLFVFVVRRRTAFWFSVAVIIVFTVLTGASASVVRAAVMGLLLAFAGGYGRLYDIKNAVVMAGAVMIFLNPLVLRFDAGFQLSFLAVLGIIYIQPLLQHSMKRLPGLGGVKDILTTTISAQITVLPLALYYFHTFSIAALPANILVLPLVPAAMLLGFIAGIAGMFIGLAGKIAGLAAWAVAAYQLAVIRWLSALPFSSIYISLSRTAFIVVTAAAVILVVRMRKKLARQDE